MLTEFPELTRQLLDCRWGWRFRRFQFFLPLLLKCQHVPLRFRHAFCKFLVLLGLPHQRLVGFEHAVFAVADQAEIAASPDKFHCCFADRRGS